MQALSLSKGVYELLDKLLGASFAFLSLVISSSKRTAT